MTTMKFLLGIAAAMLAWGLGSGSAEAETFTFRVKSNYAYKVQIAFFSQSRDHVWPGLGRAYSLDDSRTQSFPLACRGGEKICYGAWPTGSGDTVWGVGPKNDESCKRCCFVCSDGDTTPVLNLDD